MTTEFRKDLSHLTQAEVFVRQQQRAALIPAWCEALHLHEGSHILDLGAGPGYVSLELAQRCGPTGLVYAVDRDALALAYLAEMMQHQQIANIRCILADARDLSLEEIRVSAVLLTMMLHHSGDPAALIGRLKSLLRPDGRAGIAEFHPDGPAHAGPPSVARLSPELLERICQQVGLHVLHYTRRSQEHYMLIVKP